jgi:hypothetical protein
MKYFLSYRRSVHKIIRLQSYIKYDPDTDEHGNERCQAVTYKRQRKTGIWEYHGGDAYVDESLKADKAGHSSRDKSSCHIICTGSYPYTLNDYQKQ